MIENSAEIQDLRERDRRLYGNPDGPTFDQLVQESLGTEPPLKKLLPLTRQSAR
jgi:hypothetical protein